jgi:hypothetical protein
MVPNPQMPGLIFNRSILLIILIIRLNRARDASTDERAPAALSGGNTRFGVMLTEAVSGCQEGK